MKNTGKLSFLALAKEEYGKFIAIDGEPNHQKFNINIEILDSTGAISGSICRKGLDVLELQYLLFNLPEITKDMDLKLSLDEKHREELGLDWV